MSTIVLFYAVAAGVLLILWYMLSRWANRRGQSSEVQRLRQKGEELLAQNAALPANDAIMLVERLLAQRAIMATAANKGETPPAPIAELPSWPRDFLEHHKRIICPESSLELSWDLIAPASFGKLRVGRAQETGEDVIIDAGTGKVWAGQEAFPSLAHLLVFESQ